MRGKILGFELRRRWSDEEKLGIVMAVGVDDATVTQVAQRQKGLWSPDGGALFLLFDIPEHGVPAIEDTPTVAATMAVELRLAQRGTLRELATVRCHASDQGTLHGRQRGDREFVDLLLLAHDHGIEVVEIACDLAVEQNTLRLPAIVNLINQLAEPVFKPLSETYAYPQLILRPEADCKRYETLCSAEEAVA
jgi:hypothetical protein